MGYYPVLGQDTNAKTSKGRKKGYITGICYLAPGESSGHRVCFDFANCIGLCLGYEGRGRFTKIQLQRIAKTKRLFADRELFLASLAYDVYLLLRAAVRLNLIPCVRVNGTSDLAWLGQWVARTFPYVQAYDYTKLDRPWQRTTANYHLTFSYSGGNRDMCLQALAHGVNVTVVFEQAIPATFWGYEVVNGDESDLRFLDKRGVIVGLKAKGTSAKKNRAADKPSPFIIMAA